MLKVVGTDQHSKTVAGTGPGIVGTVTQAATLADWNPPNATRNWRRRNSAAELSRDRGQN